MTWRQEMGPAARRAIVERGRRHCQERSVRSKPTAAGGCRPTCVASDALERGAGGGSTRREVVCQGGGPAAAAQRVNSSVRRLRRQRKVMALARGNAGGDGQAWPGSQRRRRGITPVREAQAPAGRDAAQHPLHLPRSSSAREGIHPQGGCLSGRRSRRSRAQVNSSVMRLLATAL